MTWRAWVAVSSLIVTIVSMGVSASVSSIKSNYSTKKLSKNYTTTSSSPGYQVDTEPGVNWKPKVSLDNAYGNISKTNGVSGDIKDQIGENDFREQIKAAANSQGLTW